MKKNNSTGIKQPHLTDQELMLSEFNNLVDRTMPTKQSPTLRHAVA